MQKNTLWAILLSTGFLMLWWNFFQPAPQPQKAPAVAQGPASQPSRMAPQSAMPAAPQALADEKEVTVDAQNYRAVFTSRGAAVKHWYLKEKNGELVDLVTSPDTPTLSTFPGSNFTLSQPGPRTLVFTHLSPLGFKVTKTYQLSDDNLHSLTVETAALKPGSAQPSFEIDWGPGLGTDVREQKENISQTRALGLTLAKPLKLEKLKPGEYPAGNYQWAAVDNRYFLAALIPQDNTQFALVSVYQANKKSAPGVALSARPPQGASSRTYALRFYLGPKGLDHLQALHLNLEQTIDFGFFGFLGKIALSVLLFFHRLTGNYGWAIIILTAIIQILVMPLTLKSFKASAAMKRLQPHIKALQEKFKSDPRRLNAEMLNLYKTQKINPLGGCLPMLLQLPIFWALFTTLRNAYELRGAPWILWVKDLSAPDALLTLGGIPLNVLPLVMGIGMFLQQKMMSIATDPTQKSMMYLMPVIFTFMFWGFPSGLVLYWLTNSVLTMIEQYYIMQREQVEVA
ncbi:MAG: membrane protein insertase YidC [Endomicrobiales bacterium]